MKVILSFDEIDATLDLTREVISELQNQTDIPFFKQAPDAMFIPFSIEDLEGQPGITVDYANRVVIMEDDHELNIKLLKYLKTQAGLIAQIVQIGHTLFKTVMMVGGACKLLTKNLFGGAANIMATHTTRK